MARRAISPILSVIILIGIALAGGLFLNSISQQFFASSLSTVKYSVNDLRLEKNSDGTCFFSVELYNSGSVQIQKTTIKTTLDNGNDWAHDEFNGTTTIIEPKDELSGIVTFTGDNCGNFTSGSTYSMFVNASSAESSHATLYPVKVIGVSQP